MKTILNLINLPQKEDKNITDGYKKTTSIEKIPALDFFSVCTNLYVKKWPFSKFYLHYLSPG